MAEADDKEVPALEIVKGYDYKIGQWVTPTAEASQKEPIESTHALETNYFVEQATNRTKYCYGPYFIEAKNGGEKVYLSLQRAHTETEEFGIAKVAIKNRKYLSAVKPEGLFLILAQMHFAHDMLEPGGLKVAASTPLTPMEVQIAK